MGFSEIIDIAVSGLHAQRTRMTVTASNIANAQTTRTASGGPYRRRDPVFVARSIGDPFDSVLNRRMRRVQVSEIRMDDRPFVTRFMPGHPDANAEGIVQFPNVDYVEEQANLISASRSFQANVLVMQKVRGMAQALMEIGR